LRQTAETAVRKVLQESKSTGHGSVWLVVDAKNKLSAFERKLLGVVKTNDLECRRRELHPQPCLRNGLP
jgi:hypothetical protein